MAVQVKRSKQKTGDDLISNDKAESCREVEHQLYSHNKTTRHLFYMDAKVRFSQHRWNSESSHVKTNALGKFFAHEMWTTTLSETKLKSSLIDTYCMTKTGVPYFKCCLIKSINQVSSSQQRSAAVDLQHPGSCSARDPARIPSLLLPPPLPHFSLFSLIFRCQRLWWKCSCVFFFLPYSPNYLVIFCAC